jgi:hypothetical protein
MKSKMSITIAMFFCYKTIVVKSKTLISYYFTQNLLIAYIPKF